MENIKLDNYSYEIFKSNHNIDIDSLKERYTDYFSEFDYILGDYSYDKLRLKGYFDANNKKVKDINNIKNIDNYIKEYCSYGAKYFILKKIK